MDRQQNPDSPGICSRIIKFLCCTKIDNLPDIYTYNAEGENLDHYNLRGGYMTFNRETGELPPRQMAIGPNLPLRFIRQENAINEDLEIVPRAENAADEEEFGDEFFGGLNIVWEMCPPQKPRKNVVDSDLSSDSSSESSSDSSSDLSSDSSTESYSDLSLDTPPDSVELSKSASN